MSHIKLAAGKETLVLQPFFVDGQARVVPCMHCNDYNTDDTVEEMQSARHICVQEVMEAVESGWQ